MYEMYITVYPCKMNPSAPTNCKPIEVFQAIQLIMTVPQVAFDPENSKTPIEVVPNSERMIDVNVGTSQVRTTYFKHVEIFDDRYDFVKESLKESYSEIDYSEIQSFQREPLNPLCDPVPVAPAFCYPYIVLQFKSGGRKITTKRKYGKVFTILGELGGFRDILILVFTIGYIVVNCNKDVKAQKLAILGKNYEKNRKFLTGGSDKVFIDKKKIDEKNSEIEDIEGDVIDEATDGIKLTQKALEVEVINGFLFQDYHRALLPMVYMYQAKKRLQEEKVHKVAARMIEKSIGDKHILGSIFSGQKNTVVDREMKPDTAFRQLIDSKPANNLEAKIKQYFLANMPEDFKKNASQEKDDSQTIVEGGNLSEDFGFLKNSETVTLNNQAKESVEMEKFGDKEIVEAVQEKSDKTFIVKNKI